MKQLGALILFWFCLCPAACNNSEARPPTGSDAGNDPSGLENDASVSTDVGSEKDAAAVREDAVAVREVAPLALTAAELAVVRTLSPLPDLPPDTTNKYADNPSAATLGQRLFFERSYSGAIAVGDDGINGGLGTMGETGKISCASCHVGGGLADARSRPGTVSLGADYLTRNAPGLVNSSYYKWVNWGGRFSAQWELPMAVAENPNNMNSDRLRVAHLIFDKYRGDYEAVFGPLDPALGSDPARFPPSAKPKASATATDGLWEAMSAADKLVVNTIYVNFGKALASYVRKLVSKSSAFDDFVSGRAALAPAELAGLKIFVGKGRCVQCHSGPTLTDNDFHNLGIAQTGAHVPTADSARFTDIPPLLASPFNTAGVFSDDRMTARLEGLTSPPPDATKGQFRTPSLRNISETAPYMHAGQLQTLADVVEYYYHGGNEAAVGTKDEKIIPLNLDRAERSNLVSFLMTLKAAPLPASLLADTSIR